MAKKKPHPKATINTPAAKVAFPAGDPLQWTRAWLAKGNAPTQQMIDSGLAAQAGWAPAADPGAAPAPEAAPDAAAAPASPIDATYLAEEAQRQAKLAADHAQLVQEGAYDKQDLTEAIRRMAIAQGHDTEATRVTANKQGLFFSGQLGKRIGDVNTAYTQRQGDAQQGFDRREAARQAASAALDQGYTLDQASGLAASADRKVAADQQAALGGYLVPDAPASSPQTPGPALPKVGVAKPKPKPKLATTGFNKKRQQSFKVVRRGGQIFHQYAGGRPVRVG